MGKTSCMGCGKSLGGVFDGFGVKLMYGQICLSCKSKVQGVPGYQALTSEQMRAAARGEYIIPQATAQVRPPAPDEELRKYKQLLDEGIIDEEEFAVLKKRILDL